MANLSAAKKSLRSDARKRVYNLRRSRTMKECIKEFNDLIAAGDMKKAGELLPGTYRAIDKAAKRGVIKPNTAARRKSLLAKKLATTAATK